MANGNGRVARLASVLLAAAIAGVGCTAGHTTRPVTARAIEAPAPTGQAPDGTAQAAVVREPAVAGDFYPADPKALASALDGYLADAVPAPGPRPIALVAPHAGYVFSGQIAADAWNQAARQPYDTIVLLGTNHSGLNAGRAAIYPGTGLRTPLGAVPVDRALARDLLAACRDCAADAAPHQREHSIEVHLPFVQRLFPAARVVAIVVGPQDPGLPERLGRALASVLAGRRALLVASSDLSHYPPAAEAIRTDRRTLEAIASLDADRLSRTAAQALEIGGRELATAACGEAPVRAAMTAARLLGATAGRIVSYANSGDVAVGDGNRVVGYGAVAFTAGSPAPGDASARPPADGTGDAALTPADREGLLALARKTLTRYLESGTLPLGRGFSPAADRQRGLFVTLRKRGRLRGCIGQLQPNGPIRQLVPRMALAAAFEDRRFDKVKASELEDLEIEISLLTPFQAVPGASSVRPGRDGVALQKAGRSAVFLPQVATEEGWGRDELLDRLCEKAGLEAGCWASGARLHTFQAEVFKEHRR